MSLIERERATRRGGFARSLTCLVGVWWLAGPFAHGQSVAAGLPTPLEVTFVGGTELNPGLEGRASPVVVRVFDLTAAPAFEAADFQSLFEQPAGVLKDSLVSQEEFVLRPGDIQPRNRLVQPQVRLLGVAAAFRDLEQGVWRLAVPVTPGRRNFLLIDLNRNTIRVETIDSGHP
jgi:type VI secretion system protein VasD